MKKYKLIHLACFLFLTVISSVAFAQDDDVIGFDRQFPIAWSGSFGPPISQGEYFTVYNLFLISAYNDEQGPVFHRLSLGNEIEKNTPELMEHQGLPSSFHLEAFEVNPFTKQLVVAGKGSDGKAVIYTSPISSKAEISVFKPLEVDADYSKATVSKVLFNGPWVYFLFEEPVGGEVQKDIGGAVKLVTQEEELSWVPIPAPSKIREGATYLMGSKGIFQVGGTYTQEQDSEKSERVAIHSEMIGFDPPNFSVWKYLSLPGYKEFKDCYGVSYGAGLFVAPVVDREVEESPEEPEMARVYYALDKAEHEPSMFYRIMMDFPQADFKNMFIDPSHSWLFVLSRADDPKTVHATALKLPRIFTAKPISERMIRLKEMEKTAANPPRVKVSETLSLAKENNKYAFIVVGSGDYEEDIRVRSDMSSPRFRYTIQNTQMTYLEGDEAKEAVDQFDIQDYPAYLLVDPDGNVISSHSGSIPSPRVLLEMTRKSRIGFGPNAENQAETTNE